MSLKEPIETAEAVAEAEAQPAPKRPAKKTKPAEEKGFRVYIGPTIRNRAQYGAVFSSAGEAKEALAQEFDLFPDFGMFLVDGDRLALARLEIKTPGTALYAKAQELRKALKNHNKEVNHYG